MGQKFKKTRKESSDARFAKKSLGQNFLNSEIIRDQILEQAGDIKGKNILEIGPGLGFLTTALLESGATLTAVEKDERAVQRLTKEFPDQKNLTLIPGDFLVQELDEIFPNLHLAKPEKKEDIEKYHTLRKNEINRWYPEVEYNPNHPDESKPDNYPLGLFWNDKLVGTVRIDFESETTAIFRLITVDPSLRGYGLGSKMLALSEIFAFSKGRQNIKIFSENQAEVKNFYNKNHYSESKGENENPIFTKTISSPPKKPGHYAIIANIPYNITNPILRKIFSRTKNKPEFALLMVQKEVGQKICEPKKRSILSISVEVFAQAEYCFTVGREHFTPAPKVDSAIIKITTRDKPLISPEIESAFFTVVNAGFSEKRKKIGNVIGKFFGIESPKLLGNIDPNLRAENLSIEEWLIITKNFQSLNPV